MKETFDYAFRKIVDYATRIYTTPRVLILTGTALLVLRTAFPAVELLWKRGDDSVRLSVSDAPSERLAFVILAVALLLIVGGLALAYWDQRREDARTAKARAIVVESAVCETNRAVPCRRPCLAKRTVGWMTSSWICGTSTAMVGLSIRKAPHKRRC